VRRTEEKEKRRILEPRQCGRCYTLNGPTANYCGKCGQPLTKEAAGDLDSLIREVEANPEILVRALIKNNPAAASGILREVRQLRG